MRAAGQPAFPVDHQRQLAERHAVAHGNRPVSDAGLVFHIEDRAVHVEADGVGAVQDDHGLAVCGADAHHLAHRDIIGVETAAHVLQVEYQDVEFVDRLVGGKAALSVIERADGDAGRFVDRALYEFAGVGRAAEAVFRREDRHHVHAQRQQRIEYVPPRGDQTGLVGEDRHPLAFQEREIGFEIRGARQDFGRGSIHGGLGLRFSAASGQRCQQDGQQEESFHNIGQNNKVLVSASSTRICTLSASSGSSSSIISGHSTRQSAPLSKYSNSPMSRASESRLMR